MKIKSNEVTIREIYDKYINKDEDGVAGYNEKLNIRPSIVAEDQISRRRIGH